MQLDLQRLRALLGVPHPPAPVMGGPREQLAALAGTEEARLVAAGQTLVGAAVLVPIVLGPAPGVLLTKRTAHLNKHAGQVAFPGGRIDPEDIDAVAAALREAHEEIGLASHRVEIAGRMPDYITGTGYRVTPIVGLVDGNLNLTPSPDEVDAVFQLPMSVLLDPDAPQRQSMVINGITREFWVWPHPQHHIWGATAAMLMMLSNLLRLGER